MKIPGIIGGLGPETTARIYLDLVIKSSHKNYPRILISNVGFPKELEERIGVNGEDVDLIFPYIEKSIRQLEKAGADFIVLPCNTLHLLKDKIKRDTTLPFLDMVEEVSKEIKKKYKKIGILCTSKTRKEKLYDNLLENVKIIYPTEKQQKKVSEIIIKIIRKSSVNDDKIFLEKIINEMISSGCEKVLLACTDLANLIEKNKNIIDSVDILIERIKKEIKK